MSDPIRIPSCRGDGRCRLCSLAPVEEVGYHLPCGCFWHLSCGEEQSRTRAQHLSDLLTEALRRLHDADAVLDQTVQQVVALKEERDQALTNSEKEMEALEEKVDFGVSVVGELRSLVEELRAENLKLRQRLRKENNEFQALKVQYEQRENEAIQLRKGQGLVAEKASAWDLLAPDRERAFALLSGSPSEMPGMSWAHCLCNEVERLRRILKLTEALVPTHVPIKKYEEARKDIENLRRFGHRVAQVLREQYKAHRGDARNVNGPAREVIESIAEDLEVGL